MRKSSTRFYLTSLVTLVFLAACSVVSTGAVTIAGKTKKIEIEEYAPNGIKLEGFKVSINSEYVGMAKRIGLSGPVSKHMVVEFEPIQSKYGEIRLVQNTRLALVGSEVSFDIYINGAYSGTVQMPV